MTQIIKKIDKDTIMVFGTIDMFIPDGGSHVRQAIILIPSVNFSDNPTVIVTVYNNTVGTTFGIYGVDKVPQTGFYEVKVSATNAVAGEKSEGAFFCDYVIIGKIGIKK